MIAAILSEEQGLPMHLAIVLARQQPLRIDAALANKCRHEIDEKDRVDAARFRVEKSLKGISGQTQRCSEGMGGPRLPRDDRAAAFGDGFDEGIVEEGEQHDLAGGRALTRCKIDAQHRSQCKRHTATGLPVVTQRTILVRRLLSRMAE